MTADGRIVIDTAINTSGFQAGTKQMEAAARRAASNLDNIGTKAQINLQKTLDAFGKQNEAYRRQQQRVEALQNQLKEMREQRVKTDEYKQVTKDVEKLEQALEKAEAKQKRFLVGARYSDQYSQKNKQLGFDVQQITAELSAARRAKSELESLGRAYVSPDVSGVETKLVTEQEKLAGMNNRLFTSYAALNQKIEEYADKAKKAEQANASFAKSQNVTNSFAQKIGNGIKKASTSLKNFNAQSRSSNKSAGVGAKGMAVMALGVSSLLGALTKLRQGLTEGLKNLSKFDKGTNTAMSSLKSSLTQVKNSLATAFSPILTAIAPAINTLLSMISSALNAIGEFMAALTGQSTYTRATAVQEDYAASLDGTAKAAKDAQKQMSGLDEMTTWQSKDSGGGSGSSSGSKAFETVDVKNSPFANFAEQLKERFENQDYRGVGEAVAEKVNEAVSSWDSTGAGKSLSDKIVGVLEGAVGFLEGTNWQGLGNQIESFITAIDWSKITNLIFEGLGAVVGALLGLAYGLVKDAIVTVQDWMYWAGQATADGLFEGILNAVKDIGKWIHDNIFKPFAEGFCKAFGIHSPSTVAYGWGQDVVQGFVNGIKSIPQKVSTYFTTLKTKITTICNSITGWISGTFKKNWDSKFSQLESPLKTLNNTVKSIFNNKIKSTLNTTNSFVSGTFSEKWKKAWEGVKKIFSSVFSTFLSIAKAPINGIIGLINGLIDALNKAITGINKIKVDIPNWVPLVGGNSIGFNIPKLSKIPYLASGAVIPPNAPFTAMLGDQRHGTNLEAPEGLIRQIVREESGQGSYTFVAQINRRTIFKEIIDEGKLQQARTGKNPFVLA